MVSKKNKNKKGKKKMVLYRPPQSMTGPRPKVRTQVNALDTAAKAYYKILTDPCAGDLAHPLYAGTGAGYLIRLRQLVDIPSTWVDFVFSWMPQYAGYTNAGIWTGTATGGGALPVYAGVIGPGFLSGASSPAGAYRPVAGCLKVLYKGSELNRAGRIGIVMREGHPASVGGAAFVTASGYENNAADSYRLGDQSLEFKWVPSQADANWNNNGVTEPSSNVYGNGLLVTGVGVPAATITLELTYVIEWTPVISMGGASPGITSTFSKPSSVNSLNDVLTAVSKHYKSITSFVTGAHDMYAGLGGYRGRYALPWRDEL